MRLNTVTNVVIAVAVAELVLLLGVCARDYVRSYRGQRDLEHVRIT